MKIEKTVVLLAFVSCLMLKMYASAQDDNKNSSFRSGNHSEITKEALARAASENNTDILLAGMHNSSNESKLYCLDLIGTLNKRDQTRLLVSILNDDEILARSDKLHIGGTAVTIPQSILQEKVQNYAFKLLGTSKEPKPGLLSQKEALELASELQRAK